MSAEDESLDQLLAQIEQLAKHQPLLYKTEKDYIDKILKYQKEAIPRLIELLSHPNKDVAEIAADALGHTDEIDKKYLPKIIIGLDRGIGGLPNALGRINCPEAAKETVRRYLNARSSPANQEANAMQQQGIRTLPYMIEFAIADNGNNEGIYHLLGVALGKMKSHERKEAALALMKLIYNNQYSTQLRISFISMLRYLKEPGLVVEPELIKLRASNPELKDSVNQVLIGIRSIESGKIYSGILRDKPSIIVLRDISEIGQPAVEAGEEVVKLLKHPDWGIRRAAARALGFIKYKKSAPLLLDLLTEPSDVITNWIAAQSLGRLHEKIAESSLNEISMKHWHPAVRKTAAIAANHIKTSEPYQSQFQHENLFREFFDYEDFKIKSDEARSPSLIEEPLELKLYKNKSSKKIQKLSYNTKILNSVEDNQDNIAEHQTPDVALRVNNGWIAGSHRGEWGGELVFIRDDGSITLLLKENIRDIFTIGEKQVAVAGLSHMGSNRGMIYELKASAKGSWRAEPWRALPGAPGSTGKTKSGEIYVSTAGGGNVILSANGNFRMTPND